MAAATGEEGYRHVSAMRSHCASSAHRLHCRLDDSLDLESVAHNLGIGEQGLLLLLIVAGDGLDIEGTECLW